MDILLSKYGLIFTEFRSIDSAPPRSILSNSVNIIQLLTGNEASGNILSSGPTYHMLPESQVNNCFVIPSLV